MAHCRAHRLLDRLILVDAPHFENEIGQVSDAMKSKPTAICS